MSADVPLFANTQAAEAFGHACGLHAFPVLVRTYFTTQVAIANVGDANGAKLALAYRSQTLREAILAYLADDALRSAAHRVVEAAVPAANQAPALDTSATTAAVAAAVPAATQAPALDTSATTTAEVGCA